MKILLLSVLLMLSLNAKEYGFMECPYFVSMKYNKIITDNYLEKDKLTECFKRAHNNIDHYIEYNYGVVKPVTNKERSDFISFINNNNGS